MPLLGQKIRHAVVATLKAVASAVTIVESIWHLLFKLLTAKSRSHMRCVSLVKLMSCSIPAPGENRNEFSGFYQHPGQPEIMSNVSFVVDIHALLLKNFLSGITYGITKIQLLPISKYMIDDIFNSPEKAWNFTICFALLSPVGNKFYRVPMIQRKQRWVFFLSLYAYFISAFHIL